MRASFDFVVSACEAQICGRAAREFLAAKVRGNRDDPGARAKFRCA